MFPTKSVSSLKNLFAGYHEPLPLSKQQSQKLLDGLKTSFRNQLDREYGHAPSPSPSHGPPHAKSNSAVPAAPRHSAASAHLKAILSNPLFSYNKDSAASVTSLMALPKRDPMDVFDHAVSRGMMTLDAATGCLVAKQQLQSQLSPSDSTALRVVRWLRSSGEEKNLAFLDNQPFVRALAPFLVAEHLDAIAWDWIARAMTPDTDPSTHTNARKYTHAETEADTCTDARTRRASSLLSQLVRIKSQSRHGDLDAAIQTILHAERLFAQDPSLPRLLIQPWRSIAWLSTVESYTRAPPSATLFDAHMHLAERLPRALPVETAHLHLHHPTRPDYVPALRFFRDRDRLRGIMGGDGVERPDMARARARALGVIPWIAFLGHDTVNHLKQSGRNLEAKGVTELLRSEMAGIFGETLSPT